MAALIELDFLTNPKPELPDFAGFHLRKNPALLMALEIAQTTLRAAGVTLLSGLPYTNRVDLINEVQREVVTSFGQRSSDIRDLPIGLAVDHPFARFIYRINDQAYIRHAVLVGKPQPGSNGHLSPSAIAETVGTALALRSTLETVKAEVELLTFKDQASVEAAAILSRIIRVRMDHHDLPGKGNQIEYGLRHNKLTQYVGDWPGLPALGISLVSLRDPWQGYPDPYFYPKTPYESQGFRYGFYTSPPKETLFHLLGLKAIENGAINEQKLAQAVSKAFLSVSESEGSQADRANYALALLDEWGRFFLGSGSSISVSLKAEVMLKAGLIPVARGEHISKDDKTSITLSHSKDGSLLLEEKYIRSQPHTEAIYDLVPHHDMVKTFSIKNDGEGNFVLALDDFHSPKSRLTVFSKQDAPPGIKEISGEPFHAQNKISFDTERGASLDDINRLLFMFFTGFSEVSLDQLKSTK